MSIPYLLVIRAADGRVVKRCASKAVAHEAATKMRAEGLGVHAWSVADAVRFGIVTQREVDTAPHV